MGIRKWVLVLPLFLVASMAGVPPTVADVLDDLTKWEEGRGMCASSARLGDDGLPDPEGNVDCDRIVEPGETVVITSLTATKSASIPCGSANGAPESSSSDT